MTKFYLLITGVVLVLVAGVFDLIISLFGEEIVTYIQEVFMVMDFFFW